MRRRKGKRLISNMGVICLVTIVSLNLLGVGYGMWSDSLGIETNISTGNAKVEFKEGSLTGYEGENGVITLGLIDNRTLNVTGWCYANANIDVNVGINSNVGSVPLKFDEENSNSGEIEGFIITSEGENYINIIIDGLLNRDQNEDKNEYIYEIDKTIYFEQNGKGGWNDTLKINGEITILKSKDTSIPEELEVEILEKLEVDSNKGLENQEEVDKSAEDILEFKDDKTQNTKGE